MTPRGIRNNNPANIRHSRDVWRGEADAQPDTDFVTFAAPEWGLRAIAVILLGYQRKGLVTIRQIVTRWAPPSENDTDAYVRAVAADCHVDEDRRLDLHRPQLMGALIKALVKHENGVQPYSDAQVARGMELAGLEVAHA